MRTIAFHLRKGGVGKTTIAVSTAWGLALSGKRTLLIDMDPQGNSSSWLLEGREEEPEYQISDVLQGSSVGIATVAVAENLYCIPTFGLSPDLNNYGKGGGAAGEPYALADIINEFDYDYVVIDAGPGLGALEIQVLLAVDEAIPIIRPDWFSLDGLQVWADGVRRIEKGMRAKIHYTRLVINAMDNRIAQAKEVRGEAVKTAREVYTIPIDQVFPKSQAAHGCPQRHEGGAMKPNTYNELKRLVRAL